MREWINLLENKHYVGSCVDSFDEDGDCIIDELPWATVSDLGYADENATKMDSQQFHSEVEIPDVVQHEIADHEIQYMAHDGVYILYDFDADIHYFFV